MSTNSNELLGVSRQAEEQHLTQTLNIIHENLNSYGQEVSRMRSQIDDMQAHFHDDNPELINTLENTYTMYDHMKRALERNERAQKKPYFGRIIFHDETYDKDESLYIGRGGIAKDATHQAVIDWRAPVANAYYENGLGKCSYSSPNGSLIDIDLKLKRTYEIEDGQLLNFYDTEVISNDDLLTKYLAKNKQAVLGEIVATIQKEQNEIIRKSPYHNIIVQGVAGSGKTTVAMHRISYILYNYAERIKPDDFYIVGSNRILLNYITGVLPSLDVHGVRQMTMEQLFVRLLYEDWDEKKYGIKSLDKLGKKGIAKSSLKWFRDLERYCSKLEWDTIPKNSIYLNPRQFVEGLRDGKPGVYDETKGKPANPKNLVLLMDEGAVMRYIRQNPAVSLQSKIDMLNDRLAVKIREEFLGKGVKYTESERKAILKAYRGRYGANAWKRSIFDIYDDFLKRQQEHGYEVDFPDMQANKMRFDVYDLAALAYIYKRIKETEVISEAHHVVIDEAQDFGMMAYCVLKFCIKDCTYTIMGDVSQNIHFGCGLNDWEELRELYLADPMDSFGILKKSYRNTVEISNFATRILHHGNFSTYPVEPIIRHGKNVVVRQVESMHAPLRLPETLIQEAAQVCKDWQQRGLATIAVVCRDQSSAVKTAKELGKFVEIMESDLEKAEFGNGILVLPVEYTKGLEFDAVLILNPTREEYPVEDGHAKLLYVAATRALHELCVLHTGNLTGLIADPVPERNMRENTSADAVLGGAEVPSNKPGGASPAVSGVPKGTSPVASNIRKGEHPTPTAAPKNTVRSTTKPTISIVTAKPTVPSKGLQTDYTGSRVPSPTNRDTLPRGSLSIGAVPGASTASRNAGTITNHRTAPHGGTSPAFGDMPATETLRAPGHSKIDLAVRWVSKESDGLYLQSRYGLLRLSPITSNIIRITFTQGSRIVDGVHPGIAVNKTDRTWMYKESPKTVDLFTDELFLQVDKSTGAISYMTRDKKLLVTERSKECRQIQTTPSGMKQCRLYLDWQKGENLYGINASDGSNLNLRGSARYISQERNTENLPFVLSDKGYGILVASDGPAFYCDISTYGSFLYNEDCTQMDHYFIAGRTANNLISAYSYLCGRNW